MSYSAGFVSSFRHLSHDEGCKSSHEEQHERGLLSDGRFSPPLCLSSSPCGRFLAVISPYTVVIFSGNQFRLPLCRIARTQDYSPHDCHVAWSADSSRLYVATQGGLALCVYRLRKTRMSRVTSSLPATPAKIFYVGESQSGTTDEESLSDDGDVRVANRPSDDGTSSEQATRRRAMLLSDYPDVTLIQRLRLVFSAVLIMPVSISHIAVSVDRLLFSCAVQPTIFTTLQSAPGRIQEVLRLTDFVLPSAEWLSPRSSSTFDSLNHLKCPSTGAASVKSHVVSLCNEPDYDPSALSLASEELDAVTPQRLSFADVPDIQLGVRQFELNESLDLLGIIVTTGAAALLAWRQPFAVADAKTWNGLQRIATPSSPNSPQFEFNRDETKATIGVVLKRAGVLSIALNRPRRVAALAMLNGSVELISLTGLLEKASIQPLAVLWPEDTTTTLLPKDHRMGVPTSIVWSLDGLCLAVGWTGCDVLVFSSTGVPVMTLPRRHYKPRSRSDCPSAGGIHPVTSTISPSGSVELFRQHQSSLYTPFGESSMEELSPLPEEIGQERVPLAFTWTAMDLSLVVYYGGHLLFEKPFYRNSVTGLAAGTPGAHGLPFGNSHPTRVLIGANHLLISESDLSSLTASTWSTISLPPSAYTSKNWPLRLVVPSPLNDWILAIGRWGAAIYGTRQRRWRLFGNVQHEECLYTEHLPQAWYSSTICCLCYRSSASDAPHLTTMEESLRRRTLHKPSVTIMNDWNLIDPHTRYGVIFLDMDRKLDIEAPAAHIRQLHARPLQLFVFQPSDAFLSSVASVSNGSSSVYYYLQSLLADPCRPAGASADCQPGQSAVVRNQIAPQSLSMTPILGVYDALRYVTAYRLFPSPDYPFIAGRPATSASPKFRWIPHALWAVDLSSAGWIDHPLELRFVGSDQHLLVHHVDGNLTALTLSNPGSSRNHASRSDDPCTYETVVDRLEAPPHPPPPLFKLFQESRPLICEVETFWSHAGAQLRQFCPLAVPVLTPFMSHAPSRQLSGLSSCGGAQCRPRLSLASAVVPEIVPAHHRRSDCNESGAVTFRSSSQKSISKLSVALQDISRITMPQQFHTTPSYSGNETGNPPNSIDTHQSQHASTRLYALPGSGVGYASGNLGFEQHDGRSLDVDKNMFRNLKRAVTLGGRPAALEKTAEPIPHLSESYCSLFTNNHNGTVRFEEQASPAPDSGEPFCSVVCNQATLPTAPAGFWDDLIYCCAGRYVWCETRTGLSLLTISLRPRDSSTRLPSMSEDNTSYRESKRYRYKRLDLLTLDRRGQAIKLSDVIGVFGVVTACFSDCLADNSSSNDVFRRLRIQVQPVFDRLLSQWLYYPVHKDLPSHLPQDLQTLGPSAIAFRVAAMVSGSPHFADILEHVLHEALEACVPVLRRAVKALLTDSSKTWSQMTSTLATAEREHGFKSGKLLQGEAHLSPFLFLSKLLPPTSRPPDEEALTLIRYLCVVSPHVRLMVRVLNLFHQFEDIAPQVIISGIRKTEPLTSPALLFPLAKLPPDRLFLRGLESYQLNVIALYLIVLQNLVGPLGVRKDYALLLINSALQLSQFSLVRSLVTFFSALYVSHRHTSDRNGQAPWCIHRPILHRPPPVSAIDADDTDRNEAADAFLEMENLFLCSIIESVKKYQWLRLLYFSKSLGIDLTNWLRHRAVELRQFFSTVQHAKGDCTSFATLVESFEQQFLCRRRTVLLPSFFRKSQLRVPPRNGVVSDTGRPTMTTLNEPDDADELDPITVPDYAQPASVETTAPNIVKQSHWNKKAPVADGYVIDVDLNVLLLTFLELDIPIVPAAAAIATHNMDLLQAVYAKQTFVMDLVLDFICTRTQRRMEFL